MSGQPSSLDAAITSGSDIRNGEPIIAGTATSVRAVAELWNMGVAPEEVPVRLPHLTIQQVFAALHYYTGHRQEIDAIIAANHVPDGWAGKRFDPATGKVQ
jgi:uncharacterized protein (DUF433 family)